MLKKKRNALILTGIVSAIVGVLFYILQSSAYLGTTVTQSAANCGNKSISLSFDRSSSMNALEPDGRKKLEWSKDAAKLLVSTVTDSGASDVRISVNSFGSQGNDGSGILAVDYDSTLHLPLSADYPAVTAAIHSVRHIHSGTCIQCGLRIGNGQVAIQPDGKAVIIFSDGKANHVWNGTTSGAKNAAINEANFGRTLGIDYWVIGYGRASEIDEDVLRAIAGDSSRYFYRPDPQDWNDAILDILSQVCSQPSPTPKPSPTATPPVPTPTTPEHACTITGQKKLDAPLGICDQPEGACLPAVDRTVTLSNSVGTTIASQADNPYNFGDIAAASYQVAMLPKAGYTTHYQLNANPWIQSNAIDVGCPDNTTQTINWRMRPDLGKVTVDAKEQFDFTCGTKSQMESLPTVGGVQFELARQYYGGNTNAGMKSYAFNSALPSTFIKTTGSTFTNVVIPDFSHRFIDTGAPEGWIKAGICWYDAVSGSFISQSVGLDNIDPLSGNPAPYWGSAPGTTEVSAYVVYTPPGAWIQAQGGDIYASNAIHSEIPTSASLPFFDLPGPSGSSPGFVSYGSVSESGFDLYAGEPHGFEPLTNTLSQPRWLVNNTLQRVNFFDTLTVSVGGVPSLPSVTVSGPQLTLAQLISADCPNGVCFLKGDVETENAPWIVSGKHIVVVSSGNLTIRNNIQLTPGSFIGFIVDGNITVSSSVGSSSYYPTTLPQLHGLYVSTGTMTVVSAGNHSDTQLQGSGIFVADSFKLDRDLGIESAANPGQIFRYDPRLIFDMPRILWQTSVIQQEVAPRWWPTPTP